MSARAFLRAGEAAKPRSRGFARGSPLAIKIRDLGRNELLFGGNLNNGSNAGLFIWNGNNAVSNANWNIGSRNSDHKCVLCRGPVRSLGEKLRPRRNAENNVETATRKRQGVRGAAARRTLCGVSSTNRKPFRYRKTITRFIYEEVL